MSGQGGFIDRWSRRKRQGTERAPARPGKAPGTAAASDDTDAQTDRSDDAAYSAPSGQSAAPEPVAGTEAAQTLPSDAVPDPDLLAALPKIAEITATTDIRGFMRPGVPQAMRNAALRAAWAADPAISGYRDPAVDYFWDWNAPGGVPGGGGELVAERVAAMVRDLMDGGAPAKDAPDAAGDIAESDKAVRDAVPAQPAVDQPAENHVAGDGRGQVRAGGEGAEPQPPPRRRHGGALPG